MKQIIAIAIFSVFISQAAYADTLLTLRDGSQVVFVGMSDEGDSYCTRKAGGKYCEQKSNVTGIRSIPDGADPEEYKTAEGVEGVQGMQDRQEDYTLNSATMDRSIRDKQRKNEKIDREKAALEKTTKKREAEEDYQRKVRIDNGRLR